VLVLASGHAEVIFRTAGGLRRCGERAECLAALGQVLVLLDGARALRIGLVVYGNQHIAVRAAAHLHGHHPGFELTLTRSPLRCHCCYTPRST
jgi:hypothetical protein